MADYRRKSEVVDAVQYVAGVATPGVFGHSVPCVPECHRRLPCCCADGICCVPHVHSSEGPVLIADGDWILNGNTVVADAFFKTHYTSA